MFLAGGRGGAGAESAAARLRRRNRGLDAQHFALAGHTITAYDISPGMIAVLRTRCAEQIAAGAVRTVVGTLDDLRAAVSRSEPFDAVLCNFAVLSLIRDLRPVFRFFGDVPRPGGRLVLSIQNSWFAGDVWSRAFSLLGYPRLYATWLLWALTILAAAGTPTKPAKQP